MYRETAVSGALGRVAVCGWERVFDAPETARIVPDACTDIMWNGRTLTVAGPDTRPMFARGERHGVIVGIRFAPGRAALLGVPLGALQNARVELRELWGDHAERLASQLAAASAPDDARSLLERAVSAQLLAAPAPDPLVQRVVRSTSAQAPNVSRLAAELGLTERQLLRRCTAALGYGPKVLARILRFQRFLRELERPSARSLAEIAAALGYADQAHLAHETAELAGATPGRLRSEAALRAGEMSDFDKTSAALPLQGHPHEKDQSKRALEV